MKRRAIIYLGFLLGILVCSWGVSKIPNVQYFLNGLSFLFFLISTLGVAWVLIKKRTELENEAETLELFWKLGPLALSAAIFLLTYQQAVSNLERLDEIRATERPLLISSLVNFDLKSGKAEFSFTNYGESPGEIRRIRTVYGTTKDMFSRGPMNYTYNYNNLLDSQTKMLFGTGLLPLKPQIIFKKSLLNTLGKGGPISTIVEIDYCETNGRFPKCFMAHFTGIYRFNGAELIWSEPIKVFNKKGAELVQQAEYVLPLMINRRPD